MKSSILKLLLSKLCAMSFAPQNREVFEGGERDEKVPRQGEEEGRPTKGAQRKKGRVKTGQKVSKTDLNNLQNHLWSVNGMSTILHFRTYAVCSSGLLCVLCPALNLSRVPEFFRVSTRPLGRQQYQTSQGMAPKVPKGD